MLAVDVPELVDAPPDAKPIAPQPEQPSSGLGTQRILAIVAGVVGVGGVATGSVFGMMSIGDHSDGLKNCPSGSTCTSAAGIKSMNDGKDAATISTIAFAAGGVALAGAVALWITAPKNEKPAQSAWIRGVPMVGPGMTGLGVAGAF
jgi:hypothetical protein